MKLLLDNGADVNLQGSGLGSPSAVARQLEKRDVEKLLLKYGSKS